MNNFLFPTYVQMLGALSAWLDKAQAQLPHDDAEALLSARLAPDMFPLSTQIRFACVQALEGICRLTGTAFPAEIDMLRDEGRNAADHPGSMAHARIEQTIGFVKAIASDAHDATPIGRSRIPCRPE